MLGYVKRFFFLPELIRKYKRETTKLPNTSTSDQNSALFFFFFLKKDGLTSETNRNKKISRD